MNFGHLIFMFLVGIINQCPTTLSTQSSKYLSDDFDYGNGQNRNENYYDFLKFLEDIYSSSRQAQHPALDEQGSFRDLNNDFEAGLLQNEADYTRPIPDSNLKDNRDYELLYDFLEPEDDNVAFEQSSEVWDGSPRTKYPASEEDKQQLLVTALLEDMIDNSMKNSQDKWDEFTPDNYYEEDIGDDRANAQKDLLQKENLMENVNSGVDSPNSDGKKERKQKQELDEVLDENSDETMNEKREFLDNKKDEKQKSDVESNDVDELRSLLKEMTNSEMKEKSVDEDKRIDDAKKEKDTEVTENDDKKIKIDVGLPGVSVSKDDTYLCTGAKIADYTNATNKSIYIVEYQPHAKQTVAHHMLLYGCKSPGIVTPGAVWNCGGVMEGAKKNSDGFPNAPLCGSGGPPTIMWAWAKDAPLFKLPKDVGFKIGPGTGIQYFVLQVHYKSASVFRGGFEDHSAVSVISTYERKPYLAGVYVLASSMGTVPPHKTRNFDISCRYKQPYSIHPFAFRTHAHALGVEVLGFRIRDAEWTLIGAKSPQLPEAFYPVTMKNMTIRYNDILAARCVMDNFRNVPTSIGYRHTDEMCNFYIMFWVDARYENLLDKWDKQCNNGFPWVHWSSLPGYYN
uniref:uncharacterized protein LOC120342565 n=1 Tax=Styela clava TaxID=7725 RepID=UPI00193A67D0|nr:uncharacterized protein LOC120342565 [Styela clava]